MLLVGVVAACGGSGGSVDPVADERDGPNRGVVPTLAGGVELGSLDPTTVLVGSQLAFGAPLPSEQAAAEAFVDAPEVATSVARRVYSTVDGRHVADTVVLVLDGSQMFDESVLAAFVAGVVGAAGGTAAVETPLAGVPVLRAGDGTAGVVAVGFREANLLVVVTSPASADVELVVTRQLEARARGEVGSAAPVTPLVGLPVDAAFVAVPTVTFAPIPPPDEEVGPEPPALPAALAVQGRYGVVAGERRTVVWASAADPATYPSAEALDPAMQALVSARAGGIAPALTEVGGRVVYEAVNEPGEQSASAFRHGGLVLLVEGNQPAQVEAVVTAWIAALGAG